MSEACYLVETDKIGHNIALLRSCMGIGRIYAVVKADGYGLGCGEMARICGAHGLRCFAVGDLAGARAVRASGVSVEELLLLRPANPEEIPELAALGVTFTIASSVDAERLAGYGASVHIKVDTGMGRRGFPAEDTAAILALYRDHPNLCFTGIYTHFADPGHAPRQFRRFSRVLDALEAAGIDPGVRHCCGSGTVFRWSEMRLDGIRVGSALLGRVAGGEAYGLQRTGLCQVPIESVRTLKRGTPVGYGSTFCTRRKTAVAVCAIGTHNGFGLKMGHGRQQWWEHVLEWGRKHALYGTVRGKMCPVLGRVSTETVMLDVTGVPCREGDLVTFEINPLFLHDVPVIFRESEQDRNLL